MPYLISVSQTTIRVHGYSSNDNLTRNPFMSLGNKLTMSRCFIIICVKNFMYGQKCCQEKMPSYLNSKCVKCCKSFQWKYSIICLCVFLLTWILKVKCWWEFILKRYLNNFWAPRSLFSIMLEYFFSSIKNKNRSYWGATQNTFPHCYFFIVMSETETLKHFFKVFIRIFKDLQRSELKLLWQYLKGL